LNTIERCAGLSGHVHAFFIISISCEPSVGFGGTVGLCAFWDSEDHFYKHLKS